jgi:hypothetical protein
MCNIVFIVFSASLCCTSLVYALALISACLVFFVWGGFFFLLMGEGGLR